MSKSGGQIRDGGVAEALLNVLAQLERRMTYPIVPAAVETGALRLSGWWFDIATGDNVTFKFTKHHR